MERRLPYVYVADPYEKLERLVEDEIDQQFQSGRDTEEALKRFTDARGRRDIAGLEKLLESLPDLPKREGYPYVEPSDPAGIGGHARGEPLRRKPGLSEEELLDRIYGGWLGRCAGNLLGRPVENWSLEEIEARLRLSGDYPLADYFPVVAPLPPETPEWLREKLSGTDKNPDLRPNIDGMVRDDDLDYTVVGLHILESSGRDFTTGQVGNAWLNLFPFRVVHTAERVAYINMVNNMKPPDCALHRNPYREWIGAQIRADMWGYVNPGDPADAAQMACRDAALSHTANGIYGEMAVSGMIAAAFATSDPVEIIEAGISVIPGKSRLAEALRRSLDWKAGESGWEAAWEKLNAAYGNYHPVHAVNNAAVVALALLFGEGDFERSITISVMAGFDTDCNGATVGSLLGILLGAAALPPKWIDPLKDSVKSFVLGFENSRISDLARRTLAQVRPAAAGAASKTT